MKLPPNSLALGTNTMANAAAIRSSTAPKLTMEVLFSRYAPSIRSAIAPSARISSGTIGTSDARETGFIGKTSLDQRRGLRGAERMLIAVEQRRHRRGRHVEHGLRIEAEQQRQHDQRHED